MGAIQWGYIGKTRAQVRDAERRAAWLKNRRLERAAAEKAASKTQAAKPKSPPVVIMTAPTEAAIKPAPQQVAEAMPVPAPSERIRPENVTYASREGQSDFRAMILAAYGRCAVTGCRVEAVLEAAHIIPYVDRRSNILSNGLCLRADIHRLYDRNLIRIGADFKIWVAPELDGSSYGRLRGLKIRQPATGDPDPLLLAIRHTFIEEAR